MSEDLSHLIEIGDPEDDPVVPAPAPDPQVVIEYRDRGLPWMLVLPLPVTAAAGVIRTPVKNRVDNSLIVALPQPHRHPAIAEGDHRQRKGRGDGRPWPRATCERRDPRQG